MNTGQGKGARRLIALLVALLLAGLPWETAGAASLSLYSSAFDAKGSIPKRFTCQGENISPPLRWTGVPSAAKSLVLFVLDPDAPDPRNPKMTWVHWVVYNLPAKKGSLSAAMKTANLPGHATAGRNGWGNTEYGGPCPPIGRHRYFFKLYALDTELHGLNNPDKDAVVAAMQGHVIEKTELVGLYEKHP